MKRYLILLFIFSSFSLFAKGLPLSTEVTGEDYSWIKGRQMISVNLNPGGAIYFPLK